jgi:plastocyanin
MVATVAAIGLAVPVQLGHGQTSVQAAVSAARPNIRKFVIINNFAFSPMTITVSISTTVIWVNEQTNVPHTVTADDSSFGSHVLMTGQGFGHVFTKAGTFKYHCAIHPFMHGTVIVH